MINFAAETHVDRSIDGASDFVAANVTGVQVLLQACLDGGARRVVQVSTDEVYDSVAQGSWSEGCAARAEHCCGTGWDMITCVADWKGHDRRYSLDDSGLRPRLRAPYRFRRRAARDGAVVPGKPPVMGAAQAAGPHCG